MPLRGGRLEPGAEAGCSLSRSANIARIFFRKWEVVNAVFSAEYRATAMAVYLEISYQLQMGGRPSSIHLLPLLLALPRGILRLSRMRLQQAGATTQQESRPSFSFACRLTAFLAQKNSGLKRLYTL